MAISALNTPVTYDHIKKFDESYPYFGTSDDELVNTLQEGNIKILQIHGAMYLGKTRLAKAVARRYGEEVNSKESGQKAHLYMIKLRNCKSCKDFIEEIGFQCGLKYDESKDPSTHHLKRELNNRGDSHLFIIDGAENEESLKDILDCIEDLAEETNTLFIITSRVRICFPRMQNMVFEHLCGPMMPVHAERLLLAAAGNVDGLNHDLLNEIVKLTRRVPWAIILVGQKMKPATHGIHYSPMEVKELLERSVIDALTLNYAPKRDQIGCVLKDYFLSLNAKEKKFLAKLDKCSTKDALTPDAAAAAIAQQQSVAEFKHDIVEPLVDKSLLSPVDNSFVSNEWLEQYLGERFLEFIDHNVNEFLENLQCLISRHLKKEGYTQNDINKVLSTQENIRKPLKESFFNLIDLDNNAPREERRGLQLQVIDAAVSFLKNGFTGYRPREFMRDALTLLTQLEDRQQTETDTAVSTRLNQTESNGIEQKLVVPENTHTKPCKRVEPIAAVSPAFNLPITNTEQKQPIQESISDRKESSHARPLFPHGQPNQTSARGPIVNSVTSRAELLATKCHMHTQMRIDPSAQSTILDNTKLINLDRSPNENPQSFCSCRLSKERHMGTSQPLFPFSSLKSEIENSASQIQQGYNNGDSVFPDIRYQSSDSEIHTLQSNPLGFERCTNPLSKTEGCNALEQSTMCANYPLAGLIKRNEVQSTNPACSSFSTQPASTSEESHTGHQFVQNKFVGEVTLQSNATNQQTQIKSSKLSSHQQPLHVQGMLPPKGQSSHESSYSSDGLQIGERFKQITIQPFQHYQHQNSIQYMDQRLKQYSSSGTGHHSVMQPTHGQMPLQGYAQSHSPESSAKPLSSQRYSHEHRSISRHNVPSNPQPHMHQLPDTTEAFKYTSCNVQQQFVSNPFPVQTKPQETYHSGYNVPETTYNQQGFQIQHGESGFMDRYSSTCSPDEYLEYQKRPPFADLPSAHNYSGQYDGITRSSSARLPYHHSGTSVSTTQRESGAEEIGLHSSQQQQSSSQGWCTSQLPLVPYPHNHCMGLLPCQENQPSPQNHFTNQISNEPARIQRSSSQMICPTSQVNNLSNLPQLQHKVDEHNDSIPSCGPCPSNVQQTAYCYGHSQTQHNPSGTAAFNP